MPRTGIGLCFWDFLDFLENTKMKPWILRTATSVEPAPKDCAKDYRLTYYMKDYRVDNIDLLEHSGRFPTKGAIRRSRSSDCGRIFYGDLDCGLDSPLSIRGLERGNSSPRGVMWAVRPTNTRWTTSNRGTGKVNHCPSKNVPDQTHGTSNQGIH
jgi:hypothetical protein